MTSRDVFLGNCKLTFGNVSISGGVHISDFKICRPRFISKFRFISQISKFSDSDSSSNFKIVQISKFQKIFDFSPGEVLNSDLGFLKHISSLKLPLGKIKSENPKI